MEAAGNPRGLVVVRDELDGWFQSFARYKGAGGGSDLPTWLSLFDAGPIRYLRRTGEPREVEADRAFVAVPLQAVASEFLMTLKEFPPSQTPGDWSLESLEKQIKAMTTGGK